MYILCVYVHIWNMAASNDIQGPPPHLSSLLTSMAFLIPVGYGLGEFVYSVSSVVLCV